WSSVTTIFAKRVGRSGVSAMTQTPASGPVEEVTVPAMSSASMEISGEAGRLLQAVSAAATTNETARTWKVVDVRPGIAFMRALRSVACARILIRRPAGGKDGLIAPVCRPKAQRVGARESKPKRPGWKAGPR